MARYLARGQVCSQMRVEYRCLRGNIFSDENLSQLPAASAACGSNAGLNAPSLFFECHFLCAGFALVALGAVVILVAAGGQAGAYYDNKFVLLAYFFIVFSAFIVFCVLGGIATFGSGSVNEKFSEFWCSHEADAAKVQEEFSCCGYQCPFDRPAMGSCKFANGTVVRPLDLPNSNGGLCSEAKAAGASEKDIIDFGKQICDAAPTIEGLEGCKVKGVDAAEERIAPLFILAFASGMALFIGTFISGYLLCRKTSKGSPAGADSSAVDSNNAVPGANAPLAASATFEMTDTGDIGAGAAESK